MSIICGVFSRNSNVYTDLCAETVHKVVSSRRIRTSCWKSEAITLIQEVSGTDSVLQPYDGLYVVFSGRIDNRSELAKCLDIRPVDLADISDEQLLGIAYTRWGEETASRIYGDWSFAVWHPDEQKLFLARDHYGNTALYYYIDQNIFAFSTSRKFLLDLNLAPQEFDELYLAQVLISWMAYHGDRTIHKSIYRLPPAHSLTVTPDKFSTRQYWHLENTPILGLSQRSDYIDAFREVFEEAVHARLRTADNSPLAVTLSGGLDSSSVAVTAAELLRKQGRRLNGYTSIPVHDTSSSDGGSVGNEFPLAEATARFAGNIDLYSINAVDFSPIKAIRNMLKIVHEPSHAAGNFFWILELNRRAVADGCTVLLTGQIGNATISWTGDISSQPFAYQLKYWGWQNLLKQKTKMIVPLRLLQHYHTWRNTEFERCRTSAILPEFAQRINLFEQLDNDTNTLKFRSPLEKRHTFINPGKIMVGALHAEMGAAAGLEIRDPTADARVLAFTYSVPDRIFINPESGQDRWLIREAMKGRLPEEVRLNRRFGRQAADRVQRLRACAGEVDAVLDELAAGPAARYVDVAYMRRVWHNVLSEDTFDTYLKSGTILTRGIMAGLFVNGFEV